MIRKVLLVIVFAGIVLSLAGCKTVQGIGGDITWLGKKGEQAIER
ncbi:MAG: entericidin A/B family lipoprotein [Planctomycetota bacterium]